MDDKLLQAVRELHSPTLGPLIFCRECGDEDDLWPCRTADLVYTEGEIADLQKSLEQALREKRERLEQHRAARRAEIAAGSPMTLMEQMAAHMQTIYAPLIEQQLRP